MRRKTIAFDFDGVIHGYSKGWQDGTCYDPPVPGSIEFLRECMKTHNVFILTTRDVFHVTGYLNDFAPDIQVQGNPFPEEIFWNKEGVVLVTNRKLAAEFYVDDRAIRFFGDWNRTRYEMETLRPWNDTGDPMFWGAKKPATNCPKCGSVTVQFGTATGRRCEICDMNFTVEQPVPHRYKLWEFFHDEHKLTLTESELDDISRAVSEQHQRTTAELNNKITEIERQLTDSRQEMERRGQAIADAMGKHRGTDALIPAVKQLSDYYSNALDQVSTLRANLSHADAKIAELQEYIRNDMEGREVNHYAQAAELARQICVQNFQPEAQGWEPLKDIPGVLSQISNMAAGMRDRITQLQRDLTFAELQRDQNNELVLRDHATIERMMTENRKLKEATQKAAEKFREYEQMHFAKCNEEKAMRNREMAEYLENILKNE